MSTPADQFNALQQLVTSLQTRIAHQDQQIQAQAQQLQAQSQSLAQITVAPASATTVPVAVTPAVKLRKPNPFYGKRGEKPLLWTSRMQSYLQLANVPATQHVATAASYLEGNAAIWWQVLSMDQTRVPTDWKTFVDLLRKQYEPLESSEDARRKLRRLTQTGPVSDYIAAFQSLMASIPDMAEADQKLYFCDGLKSRTRDEANRNYNSSLAEIMAAVQRFDANNFSFSRIGKSTHHSGHSNPRTTPTSDPNAMDIDNINTRPKKLTHEERIRRIKNGLCLYCGQSGHKVNSCHVKGNRQGNGRAQ